MNVGMARQILKLLDEQRYQLPVEEDVTLRQSAFTVGTPSLCENSSFDGFVEGCSESPFI